MMDRAAEQPAGNEAEPQLGEAEKEVKATEAADGADAAAPAQPVAAAHTGKTIVVEFKGHKFKGLDDGADGFKQLNSAIKEEVERLVPNAQERRKVNVAQNMVGFTGRINDGSLADVNRYINGPANGQAGDTNFTSLKDQIKNLPAGATVRVVIVGYSHGAENAIAAVRAITTFLKEAGYTPQVHLVLIDAIQPGDADPKQGNQRLGAEPYTTLDDGQGNVRGLLASFHNYYQTLGKKEGQDKLGMVGAEIGDPSENRPIDELLDFAKRDTNLRKRRNDEATPHMAAENVLAREKADPNNPQAPVPLAVLIAQWEVQGF